MIRLENNGQEDKICSNNNGIASRGLKIFTAKAFLQKRTQGSAS
jgi:hypothetical protein